MAEHGRSLPPTRAMGIFARTVYRQLRQAGYARAEMVSFVNQLLEHIAGNDPLGAMTNVSDVETALPTPEAFLDALDFELRRMDPGGSTLVLLCEIELPDACPDEVATEMHRTIARQLRRGVRPLDTVARVSLSRYAVILPSARLESLHGISARLLTPLLQPRRREDSFPDGTRVGVRAAAANSPLESARELFERCVNQPAEPLARSGGRESTKPSATFTLPPPAKSPIFSREREQGVALALGGGAARAAAHTGVLRALAAHGVRPAAFAGTSAGALVSAMTCLGNTPHEIQARFEAMPTTSLYREMRRRYAAYRRASKVPRSAAMYFRETGIAFLSQESIAAYDDEMLESFVELFVGPDRDIASLPMPLAVATTDLVTGRSIHIQHGSLHTALRASCALPGLFPPQRDGDHLFVDGSLTSDVPVRAAIGLETGLPVVAVHLAQPVRTVTAYETSSDVVLRTSTIVRQELAREQLRHADTLIVAHVEMIGWLDFRRAGEAAAIGERAALRYLDRVHGVTSIPPAGR